MVEKLLKLKLKNFFATTAERTLKCTAKSVEDIHAYIHNIITEDPDSLRLHHVTYQEVFKQMNSLCNDTSTGSDQIPASYLKMIADHLASPLTHIIKSYITNNTYPYSWKLSRVVLIPKKANYYASRLPTYLFSNMFIESFYLSSLTRSVYTRQQLLDLVKVLVPAPHC